MFEATSLVPLVTFISGSSIVALTILLVGKGKIKHEITLDVDVVVVP